jgi:TP901 family phage tail tape measure protein
MRCSPDEAEQGEALVRSASAICTRTQQTLQSSSLVSQLTGQLQQGTGAARNFGIALTAGITLPLAGAVAYIATIGSQTQSTRNQFQGVSRATVAEMERVSAKARELGADLSLPGTSSKQAAESMLELNKGGLSIQESMEAARGSIQLARAAIVSEGVAAEITASALNTYKLAGDQAGRVSDVLANAANKSTGEITDFASGLAQAGQIAHSSNITLEETVAVLALMANSGVKGSDAGTSFKTFLLALRGPSDDARKAMKALGVEAYDLQTGKLKALPVIVDEFSKALGGMKDNARDAALDKIFGSDAARVAIALFGEGRKGLDSYIKAMSESGTAARVAEANTRGLQGAWDGLMSTIDTLADDVFQDIEPVLSGIVRGLGDAASGIGQLWNSLAPGAKAALVSFVGFLAALGPVIAVVGTAATAFLGLVGAVGTFEVASAIAVAAGTTLTAALAPVILVALKLMAVVTLVTLAVGAGVAAMAAAWSSNFLGIRDITAQVFERVKSFVLTTLATISEAWARIYPTLASITQKVLAAINSAWEKTGKVLVAAVLMAWDKIAPVLNTLLQTFLDMVETVAKTIDGDWNGAWVSFSRIVVRAIDELIPKLREMETAFQIAFATLIGKVAQAADDFAAQAIIMVVRFIAGFAQAMANAEAELTAIIAQTLVMAAAGVDAASIGAAIMAQMMAGMRGQAAQTVKNSSGSIVGNEDADTVHPWEVGQGSPVAPPKSTGGLKGLSGGGGGHRGGGGESAAVKAAKLELEAIKIVEEASQRSYARRLSDAQHYYDVGRAGTESYYISLNNLAEEQFKSELRIANKQLELAKLTKGSKERINAITKAQDESTQVYERFQERQTENDRKKAKERLEIARSEWDSRLSVMQERTRGFEMLYQRMADKGVISFTQAGHAIAALQEEIFKAQERTLLTQLNNLDKLSAKYGEILNQLRLLRAQRDTGKLQAGFEAQDNTQRDYESLRNHQSRVRGLWESIADIERDTQQDRIRILEAAGVRKEEIWKRQLAFDLESERIASERRIAELKRDREGVEASEINSARKAEIITALNAKIEAEERRTSQARDNIAEDYYKKQDDRLRGYVDKAMGVLKKAVDAFKEDGLHGFAQSLISSFRDALLTMTEDLLKSRLLALLRNVMKLPAPGSTQGADAQQPAASVPGFAGGVIDIFRQFMNAGARRSQHAPAIRRTVGRSLRHQRRGRAHGREDHDGW